MTEEANTRGRPTSYDPVYCDQILEYGKMGKSVAWMAGTIGVNKDTLYEWSKVHEDFSVAFTQARLYSQIWWEDRGQEGMVEQGFSATIWSRSMAARFPADWREVKGQEVTGLNGGPIETVNKIERLIVDTSD